MGYFTEGSTVASSIKEPLWRTQGHLLSLKSCSVVLDGQASADINSLIIKS